MRMVNFPFRLFAAVAGAGFAVLLCAAAFGADGARSVPFVFEHNKIFIDDVYIGDAGPYRATLDTGTSDVIIDPAIAVKLGLKAEGETSARATGGTVKVFKVKNPGVRAGEVSLLAEGGMISVTPVSDQAAPFEEPTQLVIGYPLFRRNVVEIDYGKRVITLIPAAGYIAPAGAVVLEINLSTNLPVAKVEVEGHEASAMLDTGSNSALDTYPDFISRTGLAEGHAAYGMPVVGMGGAVLTNLMRLKSVKVAGHEFDNVRIYAHSRQLYYGLDALVGNEILRRYKVVFDYARGKAYLTPGADLDSPLEEERAGLVVLKLEGRYVVATVVNGSPAEKAGVKAEDVITKINGDDAGKMGVPGLRRLVRGAPGEKIVLVVKRGGAEVPLEITLEDYVK